MIITDLTNNMLSYSLLFVPMYPHFKGIEESYKSRVNLDHLKNFFIRIKFYYSTYKFKYIVK